MRPINADALKEFIESVYRPLCDDYHMKDYVLDQILTDIKKEPSQTAMPEVHTCRYWRIGTTCVDYCARASEDGWMKAMLKEGK